MPRLPTQPQLVPCTPKTCPEHQPALGLGGKAGQDLGDAFIQPCLGSVPPVLPIPGHSLAPFPLSHQPLMQNSKNNFAEF